MIRARIRMFGNRMVVLLGMSRSESHVSSTPSPAIMSLGFGGDRFDSYVLDLTASVARQLRSPVEPSRS